MKFIDIKDYYGKLQHIPVSDELYEAWKDMYREENRNHKREMYHRDFTDMAENAETISRDSVNGILDQMIAEEEKRRLYEAIASLTPLQQRRIYMFMECMDYTEVARREHQPKQVIYNNIQKSFRKLRKYLTD